MSSLASRGVDFSALLELYDSHQASPEPEAASPSTSQAAAITTGDPDEEPSNAPASRQDASSSSPAIVNGSFNPLSTFFKSKFVFHHKTYYSIEHAFQSFKANIAGLKALGKQIRFAPSPLIAKRLAKNLPHIRYSDLYRLMEDLLREKVKQCPAFRAKLRDSGTSRILHSTNKDKDLFWATGLDSRDIAKHSDNFPGLNMYGQLLEKIRSELKDECEYLGDIYVEDHGNYVVFDNHVPQRQGFWNGGTRNSRERSP